MQKFLGLTLSMVVLNSIPLQALAAQQDSEVLFNQTRQYFNLNEGLDLKSYSDMQKAQGLLKERQPEGALKIVLPLQKQFPDQHKLPLLAAAAYLQMNEPEKALVLLDNLSQTLKADDDSHDKLTFQLVELQAQAYLQLNEKALALKLFQTRSLNTALLSQEERDRYSLLQARLYFANQNYAEAYHTLLSLHQQPGNHSSSHIEALKLEEEVAEKLYAAGLKAYNRHEDALAVTHLEMAHQLNPKPVKYSQLLSQAQSRFMQDFKERFQRARPILQNTIRNMRDHLAYEDYNALYHEYLRLKQNEDVGYLLRPEYKAYLPLRMAEVLTAVEKSLEVRGMKLR